MSTTLFYLLFTFFSNSGSTRRGHPKDDDHFQIVYLNNCLVGHQQKSPEQRSLVPGGLAAGRSFHGAGPVALHDHLADQ